jgi:hypothetical protein
MRFAKFWSIFRNNPAQQSILKIAIVEGPPVADSGALCINHKFQ